MAATASQRPGIDRRLRRVRTEQTRGVVDVCRLDELPPGSRMIVEAGRREIGVFNLGGRLHGMLSTCPHQRGPVCDGRISGTLRARAASHWDPEWVLDGEVVTCPWHGLEFHIPSGQCLAYERMRVRVFDVFAEDGVVKLRL